jgi:hypothetical protein
VALPYTLAEITEQNFGSATDAAVRAIHAAGFGRDQLAKDSHKVLSAVLNSEIDADKVSYLTEDAGEAGVKFGLGIDLDGLLGAIRAPSPPDVEHSRGPIIGITTKGLAAAESVLVSRNEMYERVYWHHSTRSMAAMIKYCLTRLFKSGRFSMPDFVSRTFFLEQGEVLRVLWSEFEQLREPTDVNPVSSLREGERGLYKLVHETSEWPMMACSIEQVAAYEDNLTVQLSLDFPTIGIRPGELVIDLPIKQRGMTAAANMDESVYVYEGSSYLRGRRLGDATTTVKHVREIHQQRGSLCRLYVSRRVFSFLTDSRKHERFRQKIVERLGA